ncbi:E3 ubiquitin-protein ligase PPP1R11 isoform X1 [Sapajus apella]|uniref:E3 ubiquitin-protein ligase PPP1R11 n=1 Tax=Sapajus apella TaxID=9515 RepID=A0A6J3HDD6_SAPAP|nr:E3 ubiquitin-protein ligase PPP1R11 isoform X1 [Sapajus apella]
MAEAGAGLSETVTETTVTVTTEPENRSLTIKLRKRKPEKKVEWTSDTVDNEHMGRRSSKCCCIYEKPRAFGESSTESDEEEEEGCGHTHCREEEEKSGQRSWNSELLLFQNPGSWVPLVLIFPPNTHPFLSRDLGTLVPVSSFCSHCQTACPGI